MLYVAIAIYNQYLKYTQDNFIEINLLLCFLNCHTSGVPIHGTNHTLSAYNNEYMIM